VQFLVVLAKFLLWTQHWFFSDLGARSSRNNRRTQTQGALPGQSPLRLCALSFSFS